jgi:CRP-like cAMP-binding protein
MELTLDSALSGGAMVGHLSYVLLVISMMMRSMSWLRALVILSALVAIAYDFVWLRDPVGVFWETMLVSVNLVQLSILWLQSRRARFTPEEQGLVDRALGSATPAMARRFLDGGFWTDAAPGDQLTREGAEPTHLTYLADGEVDIRRDGRHLTSCGAGSFIGEMSLFDPDERASATAVVATPARCWRVSFARIRHWRRAEPDLATLLEAGLARDMRRKIVDGNLRAADG